jgi:hypothetical protein
VPRRELHDTLARLLGLLRERRPLAPVVPLPVAQGGAPAT